MSKEKRKRVILGVITSITILMCLLWVTSYIAHKIWFFPKSEVEVVSFVDFWSYQEYVEIESFRAELKEARFGLMSLGQALIQINIKGQLKKSDSDNDWLAEIEKVQVSERLKEINKEKYIELEVIPLVNLKKTKNKTVGNKFNVNIEYVVHAYQWGNNVYIFKCGNNEQKISSWHTK